MKYTRPRVTARWGTMAKDWVKSIKRHNSVLPVGQASDNETYKSSSRAARLFHGYNAALFRQATRLTFVRLFLTPLERLALLAFVRTKPGSADTLFSILVHVQRVNQRNI